KRHERRKGSHSNSASPVHCSIMLNIQNRKVPARRETTTKLSSITRRSFCQGLTAMAVLPLAARCGAMAQTYPRHEIQTSILEVPRARLYYDTYGSGPVMMMAPGPLAQPTASEG